MSGGKVLLVGWDAADWRVLRPMMARGEMPHLSGLVSRGVASPLASPRPLLSPALWSTVATGRPATAHGVLSSVELSPDRSRLVPVGRSACRAEPVWEVLARAGVPVHSVNFPATHPARPTGGVSASNRFPEAESVWPAEHAATLDEFRLTAADIDAASLLTFVPRAADIDRRAADRVGAVAEALAQTATTHNLITWAMEHVPWRLAAVCYTGIHQLSHAFMPFHPPRPEGVDERDFELYRHVVTAAYRFHDLMLGRLLQLAGEGAHVIVVSDHGFYSDHLRPPAAATTDEELIAWHRPQGIAVAAGPGIARGELVGASVLDVAPTVLGLFGMKGEGMAGQEWFPNVGGHRARVPCGLSGSGGDKSADAVAEGADVQHLLDLGYVERFDPYAEAAVQRLADRRQFHLAEAWLDAGRAGEAVSLLEALVRRHPLAVDYRAALAHAYAGARRLDECRRLVEELRREFPESAEALAGLGMLELAARRASSAVEHLRRAEALGRRSPDLYADLGQAYLRLRLFEDAARAFRQATELDAETARAWAGLGAAELGRGETESAIDAARHAIRIAPGDAEAHYRLGRALVAASQDRDARRALESAVAIDPGFAAALRKLSELAERAGDVRAAREYDRRAHLALVRKRWGGSEMSAGWLGSGR